MSNQSKRSKKIALYRIKIPGYLTLLSLTLYIIYDNGIFTITTTITAIVFLGSWISLESTCPRCKELHSMVKIGSKLIDKRDTNIEKQVTDKVYKTRNDIAGKEPHEYIERTVYISGEKRTYQVYYRCNQCGYINSKNKINTVEK